MKFGTSVRLEPSNNRGEFELDRARRKNNIAENSFALGHETDNKFFTFFIFLSHWSRLGEKHNRYQVPFQHLYIDLNFRQLLQHTRCTRQSLQYLLLVLTKSTR